MLAFCNGEERWRVMKVDGLVSHCFFLYFAGH